VEPEMTPEEERTKTKELLTKMERHVAMAAFVVPEPATPYSVINNGTASFLELPKGKFIITNYHIWDAFQQQRREVPGLRLAVMGEGYCRPVDITTAKLVDEDEGLDLAVLQFEANDVIEAVGKKFYVPKQWPLCPADDGGDMVVVGYPGNRKEPTQDYLRFESFLLGLTVLSVSDRKYMLGFVNPNPAIQQFSSRPIDAFTWGGMSGSMAYRLDLETNQFHVAGFLHAAGEGLQASFFAGRADVLQDDGKIRRVS
jgi:hypothetical protein